MNQIKNSRMKIQAFAEFTSPGARPVMEDCLLMDGERGVFVVADGFGGPGVGDAQSRLACESVRAFLYKEAGDQDATLPFVLRSYYSLAANVLFNSLIHANRKLLKANHGKGGNEKGGASVAAGFLDGDLLALAQVGNCSAWLYRGERAVELLRPNCFSQLLDPFGSSLNVPFGSSNPVSPSRIPLAALGVAPDLEPQMVEVKVRPGDRLFLGTDGAVDRFRLAQAELSQGGAPGTYSGKTTAQQADQIIAWARAQTFDENASFALIYF